MVSCRSTYDVGTSTVSIEPTGETVSLALAGYAAPPLGRFTLTWEDKGQLPDALAIASVQDKLYLMNGKGEYAALENDDVKTLQPVGKGPRMLSAAEYRGGIYGVASNGDLLVNPKPVSEDWTTAGHIKGAMAIAAAGDHLYVAANGELLEGTISGEAIAWQKVGPAKDVVNLTSDGKKLYAVTSDNYLLQCYPGRAEWLRIGYKNGETYTIDIKQVAYVSGKLYVLAADGHLYRSRHSTEGNMSARAMAIKKGRDVVVIAGVDVCGLDYSFTQSIKKEIARQRGIPMEAVMINASHTHFVPVTQNWQTWGKQCQYPDSTYLNKVVRAGIIRAIEEALDNMRPSYLSFGRDTTDIGRNRSLKGDLAIYDNDVDVLQAVSTDKKHNSLLFLTGCHPVTNDPSSGHYSVSANFPGYAREVLQKAGYENSIFLQGCAGDINPKHPFKTSGLILATDVLRALTKGTSPVNGGISFKMDSVGIPVSPWPKEKVQAFRDENAPNMGTAPGGVVSDGPGRDARWADKMLNYYETKTMPAAMPVYIQIFDIGNWRLVGLSREVTTEFGLAIKNLWPEKKVSVIAYTNDVASYLATDPHIKAKDYEGYGSFFWYGQPAPFPEGVFDTVVCKAHSIK
jgi:hypothetical protein